MATANHREEKGEKKKGSELFILTGIASSDRIRVCGLPYGNAGRVKRLAKRLNLDLAIRRRGRLRKQTQQTKREK